MAILLTWAIGILFATSTWAADPECFQLGFCASSFALEEVRVPDPIACLKRCQSNPECEWWSFFEDIDQCALLTECAAFKPEQAGVISGSKSCPMPEQTCGNVGLCSSEGFIWANLTINGDACGHLCHLFFDCQFYSFQKESDECHLFSDCPSVEETDYATSMRHCPIDEGPARLLLVNGYPSYRKVEYVELSNTDLSKNPPEEYIIGIQGATGFLWERQLPTVCGGEGYGFVWEVCYQLDGNLTQWIEFGHMTTARFQSAGLAFYPEGEPVVWILGGIGNESQIFASTELLIPGGAFSPGPVLPNPLHGACAIELSANEILIIGGSTHEVKSVPTTHIYSWTDAQWRSGPELSTGRTVHACFKLGDQVIVVGGVDSEDGLLDSVEILDGTGVWKLGPQLPRPIAGASLSQAGGELILVGGWTTQDEGGVLDTILHFTGSSWITLEQRMEYAREFTNVFEHVEL